MYKGLMTLGDWTVLTIHHGDFGDRMYASHDCPANKSHMNSGNLTRCHICSVVIPDEVQGLLELYNMDWSVEDA